jgi:hypothetical protein
MLLFVRCHCRRLGWMLRREKLTHNGKERSRPSSPSLARETLGLIAGHYGSVEERSIVGTSYGRH